ncbi:MAG: glutamate synthase, partial [bacterium]
MKAPIVGRGFSRAAAGINPHPTAEGREAEGGCGVIGLACTIPLPGRYIIQSSCQMHNRGNGKGGGIAAMGLDPEQMRVSLDVLENDYLIQIALLDPAARTEVESHYIAPNFYVHQAYEVPHIPDFHSLPDLEVKPPDILRYFVRVKMAALEQFMEGLKAEAASGGLSQAFVARCLADPDRAEDEFVYRNSYRLNKAMYASLGEKRAFVLNHGKNLLVFKVVGYAEQAAFYYQLEDLKANIWISHQRYPTKGKVWHPGGAHPFIGLHEALVHNGDFANYQSVSDYLRQHGLLPLFLTDTEVSVLLFDLLGRRFNYPLEFVIEALAPTTERDFVMLPEEKQKVYRAIQTAHIHGSPDGPWFFIIARNDPGEPGMQLVGITDTSMLRPQVFALHENGEVKIGLIASEKQAIDAVLAQIAADDTRFCPVADKYWNARGGSHTDGGAFMFTLVKSESGASRLDLICADKFGTRVATAPDQQH